MGGGGTGNAEPDVTPEHLDAKPNSLKPRP